VTFYPVFLNLRGRRAVVIGGGAVAEQKVQVLLSAGAHVTVVSPETTPRLAELAAAAGSTYGAALIERAISRARGSPSRGPTIGGQRPSVAEAERRASC